MDTLAQASGILQASEFFSSGLFTTRTSSWIFIEERTEYPRLEPGTFLLSQKFVGTFQVCIRSIISTHFYGKYRCVIAPLVMKNVGKNFQKSGKNSNHDFVAIHKTETKPIVFKKTKKASCIDLLVVRIRVKWKT